MPKVDLRQAELEREDDAATWCRTCTAPAEEGSLFCRLRRVLTFPPRKLPLAISQVLTNLGHVLAMSVLGALHFDPVVPDLMLQKDAPESAALLIRKSVE